MKKIIALVSIVMLLVLFSALLVSLEPEGSTNNPEDNTSKFRYAANDAYGFGEKLEYKVGYKFITAGTGYFHILPKPAEYNGRQCYDVRFEVKSLSSLEWLYKVQDAYRTMIDVQGIFPWHFEQHIREGSYKKDFKADFDQENHYATTDYKGKKKKFKVEPYIHDIVSAFFYVRTLNLRSMPKDTIFYLKNFFNDSSYTLGVKILGKQTIEVEAGKFRCIVIEPLVVDGGLFKSEGRIMIWLTDDERKIPVKVGTKIIIGFVGAELTKYSGLRGEVKAKIEK